MQHPELRAGAALPGWALAGLLLLTALRLAVAGLVPLSPDEAYYWVWSRALAAGYLDHPPMVALWIRAGTALAGDTAIGVRLLAPLAAACGSLLLADAAERLLPGRRAGLVAVALLNATLALGVGSVTMTPDAPLLLFWTLGLWGLARLNAGGRPGWWLVVGAASGLALASKYTAIFLPLGALLWLLAVPAQRVWLRRLAVWAGAALGLALFAPVLAWNAAHGWASFLKQGGRAGAWDPARALRFVAELVGGQIGLATPLVFLLCAAGLGLALRRTLRARDRAFTLLACLSLPAALVFLQHALGDRVQGNWPAILYPAAAIAAAGLEGAFWRRLVGPAVALGGVLSLGLYVQAIAAPLRLSIHADPTLLRLAGWRELALEIDRARLAEGAAFVAADGYGPAAELAWYLPPWVEMVGVEPRWGFVALPPAGPVIADRTGLLVRSARRGEDLDPLPWAEITGIGEVIRGRNGMAAEGFRLYRVRGRASASVAVALPRPGGG